MSPIETLMEEHRRIEAVLRVLSKWARAVGNRRDDPRAELGRFVAFIQSYADALHHGKEEDLLFAVMVERGFSREQGPIAVMLEEHGEARELTEKMRSLSERSEPWTEEDRRAAARTALAYAGLLTEHIEKEDQILYPMAESELTPEDMAGLVRSFDYFDSDPAHSALRSEMLALSDSFDPQPAS